MKAIEKFIAIMMSAIRNELEAMRRDLREAFGPPLSTADTTED